MNTVRRILAEPTGGGEAEMKGQIILEIVRISRAIRLDGAAHPTPGLKPWLIQLPKRG
jgi:peptidyl-prolyl cis-trans isomerase A (cyclophilin A)